MFRGRGAGYIATLIVVHVHVLFCVNCDTNNQNQQQLLHKNSCGDIDNIGFPFRLNPLDNCGDKNFEFECENNRTVLYLYSGKYYVQAINYSGRVISVVDVGIQRNNCSYLPLHSLTPHNIDNEVSPTLYSIDSDSESFVALVSCEKPVKSPLYIDTTSNISTAFCENRGRGGGEGGVRGSPSSKKHSYVLVGSDNYLDWSDVANLCSVDMLFPTRLRLPDGRLRNMTSLLEVHNALADGFDLKWRFDNYQQCRRQARCFSNYDQNATVGACRKDNGRLYGIWAFLDGLKYDLKYQLSNDYDYDEIPILEATQPISVFLLSSVESSGSAFTN
ncbi:hypothetical protein LOK49_LG07G00242 [Camellia lanceoleosa]|uniref:Uncharacterized protein n=1 Tax=Camellia lanceoleosa TaxID=1840588 RepID=A0ACC0H1I5_9ERIC|nr:hypothetical protein LOK49_LG07G00242 [Camellia lanceoleosa]